MKSGRTPISVVLNEASKRKSSAQVAFVDGARLFGDEAAALNVKYPEKVYARYHNHASLLKCLQAEVEGVSVVLLYILKRPLWVFREPDIAGG